MTRKIDMRDEDKCRIAIIDIIKKKLSELDNMYKHYSNIGNKIRLDSATGGSIDNISFYAELIFYRSSETSVMPLLIRDACIQLTSVRHITNDDLVKNLCNIAIDTYMKLLALYCADKRLNNADTDRPISYDEVESFVNGGDPYLSVAHSLVIEAEDDSDFHMDLDTGYISMGWE